MEKISLSPIEVKQIEGRTHDDRISRLEHFLVSKLDDGSYTLYEESLLEVILNVVNRHFYIKSELQNLYRE